MVVAGISFVKLKQGLDDEFVHPTANCVSHGWGAQLTARKDLSALLAVAREDQAAFLPGFFRAVPVGYDEGDQFLGCVVPDQRKAAIRFRFLSRVGYDCLHGSDATRWTRTMNTRRLSRDEIGRRGSEIYETHLKVTLELSSRVHFVAIDVETGEYEVADEAYAAGAQLRQRLSDPQVFTVKVGHAAAFHALGFQAVQIANT